MIGAWLARAPLRLLGHSGSSGRGPANVDEFAHPHTRLGIAPMRPLAGRRLRRAGERRGGGRIFCLDAVGPQGRPWMWASGHNGDIKRAAYGYEAPREAAMGAVAKSWPSAREWQPSPREQPLELLPAVLLHWSTRRGRALIPPIESAAHELSMQLPTQRYNNANPPLLWRC